MLDNHDDELPEDAYTEFDRVRLERLQAAALLAEFAQRERDREARAKARPVGQRRQDTWRTPPGLVRAAETAAKALNELAMDSRTPGELTQAAELDKLRARPTTWAGWLKLFGNMAESKHFGDWARAVLLLGGEADDRARVREVADYWTGAVRDGFPQPPSDLTGDISGIPPWSEASKDADSDDDAA
ncbi:hypothetical protein [Smaragdicoccus niigatensis]|uniref:hypothetical protein n=1 Tax=Smaragdicoccus niigatensis TaxID=359359 RepID=UPI00037806DC|nr:hypothetical protein [Smaragdicoccus niigatensis]